MNGHHVHIVVSSYTFTLPQPTSPQLGKVARRKFVCAGILVCERFFFFLENISCIYFVSFSLTLP